MTTFHRVGAALLALTALATVLAVLSCWNVGWLSDDWVMLHRAQLGVLFEESRHLSVPRRLLWWAAVHGTGPWPFRLVGLGCHLVAGLVVLPRVATLLFPTWGRGVGYLAGLALLALPSTFEPLVWASAVPYAILELELLVVAYAHLCWLRDGGWARRGAALLATAAALVTWELGVTAPLVVMIVSALRTGRAGRVVRDAMPHVLLVGLWLALKVGLGSTETVAWRGPIRAVGHLLAAPLLVWSPWPPERHLFTAWSGVGLTVVVLGLALAAAWRAGRTGAALLLLAWGVMLPVLLGPGPEARYLMLAAPWLVLLGAAGVRDLVGACGRAGRAALMVGLVAICATTATASWWTAGRWRAADGIARGIADGVIQTARARERLNVVVIDAPDRLPHWGPTSKVPVWRHGLASALAMRGVRLVGQAHTPPGDPDVLGLRPHTRPWGADDLRWWRARGLLVLVCRPDGHGGYEVVVAG